MIKSNQIAILDLMKIDASTWAQMGALEKTNAITDSLISHPAADVVAKLTKTITKNSDMSLVSSSGEKAAATGAALSSLLTNPMKILPLTGTVKKGGRVGAELMGGLVEDPKREGIILIIYWLVKGVEALIPFFLKLIDSRLKRDAPLSDKETGDELLTSLTEHLTGSLGIDMDMIEAVRDFA